MLPDLPNGFTYLLLRPLMLPLALVCLVLGFVLWRFMGDVPSVLTMGFRILFSAAMPKAPPSAAGAAPAAPAVDPVVAGLRAISARDGSFDATALLAYVLQACTLLAKAWVDRDLEPCRGFLSEDSYELQKAQMARGLVEGWRLFAANVSFADGKIVAAAANEEGDGVTVRIQITGAPEAVKVVRGRRVSAWVEDWLFRRTLALTPASQGVRRQILRRGDWKLIRADHVAVHYERAA